MGRAADNPDRPGGALPAHAYDNPELLPDHPTPVIDLAKAFTDPQRSNLEKRLNQVEESTGWKLRVLTQYERTPGRAVKEFWGLDESSLLLVADPRGATCSTSMWAMPFFALMPRTYWVELQTRFGNQYYVKEHGEDGAIIDALNAVEVCLERGGCQVVPGLPLEQWLWTLTTSAVGGLIAGFAAYPRKEGNRCLVLVAAALTAVGDVVRCVRHCACHHTHLRRPADCAERSWFPDRRRCRLFHCPGDGGSTPERGAGQLKESFQSWVAQAMRNPSADGRRWSHVQGELLTLEITDPAQPSRFTS